MEMQGLKPSVLMGKLKQHLPAGVSPDNDLFLAMFLVRLPSMHETVGAGNHKTAAAMVKAADALWDARGSHDPTVEAATTQQSRPPQHSEVGALFLTTGSEATKRVAMSALKAAPLPAWIFIRFKTLAMASVSFTITMPIGLPGALRPVLGWKTKLPPNHLRFGGQLYSCHCHGNAFSCQCRFDFLN